MRSYSAFFKTLHDETGPTGYLGRGTHYSVLRAIVFHDQAGEPLSEGQFLDFAVIWDEDHDTRVMETIEEIYRRGSLSSFEVFGERKGFFTAVLSSALSKLAAVPFYPELLRRVDELELSVRLDNCLKNEAITYLGELVQRDDAELLRIPNFGRKILNELKEVLAQMNLHLNMQIPGWASENIGELAKAREHVEILKLEVKGICASLNDPWASNVLGLSSAGNVLIDDDIEKVDLYLKNIQMLWQLGMVPRRQQQKAVLSDRLVPDADSDAKGTTTTINWR